MAPPSPTPLVHFFEHVAKRPSPFEGTGLFATADLPSGHVVTVKGGHVMTRAERDRVAQSLGPAEIQVHDDLFIGPLTSADRDAGMMHLNHSCDPNCGIQGQIVFATTLRAVAARGEAYLRRRHGR